MYHICGGAKQVLYRLPNVYMIDTTLVDSGVGPLFAKETACNDVLKLSRTVTEYQANAEATKSVHQVYFQRRRL